MKNYLVVISNYAGLHTGDEDQHIYLTFYAPNAEEADKMGDTAAEQINIHTNDRNWFGAVIGPTE